MRTALVTLILIQVLTLPLAQAQVNIRGVVSCGTWLKERARGSDSYETIWIIGHLSGLAVGLNRNFWGRVGVNSLDNESVFFWMDNYCRANPLQNLAVGALDLFFERCPTDKSCR